MTRTPALPPVAVREAATRAPVRRVAIALFASLVAAVSLLVWQSARPAQGATAAEQRAFIDAMLPGAEQGWQEFGVPVSVTISQAILESGWGGSSLSKQYNAYFGIKCIPNGAVSPYQSGCVALQTQEYVGGSWQYTTAYFRSYASATDSLADHGYYLKNRGIYDTAFTVNQDPRLFAQEIQRAGYATDPNYAHLLYKVMVSSNLFQYDRGTRIGEAIRPTNQIGRAAAPVAPTSSTATRSSEPSVSASTPTASTPTASQSPSASASAAPSTASTQPSSGIVLEDPPLARQQGQDPQIVHPNRIFALPTEASVTPTPAPTSAAPATPAPASTASASTGPTRPVRPKALPSTGD